MKKGLIIGIIAGAAAAVAATVFVKKKKEYDYYNGDIDDNELSCDDCCGDCCECDDDEDSVNEIPADKTEESVIITDACACGGSEEEALDKIEDAVESDEV